MTALLLALTLTLLPAALSGCEKEGAGSPSSQSAPTVSSEPSPTPEATAAPTPQASPTPTPEPAAPALDVEALFAENPIDAQQEEDLANAFTGKDAYLAFQTARESWTLFVDRLTDAISNQLLDGQEKEDFDKAAEDWLAKREEALHSVLDGAAEEDILQADLDKATEAAAAVAAVSQERALELCKKYAELTGEFPDFEALLQAGPMG